MSFSYVKNKGYYPRSREYNIWEGGVTVKKKIVAVTFGIAVIFSGATFMSAAATQQTAMNKAEFVSA